MARSKSESYSGSESDSESEQPEFAEHSGSNSSQQVDDLEEAGGDDGPSRDLEVFKYLKIKAIDDVVAPAQFTIYLKLSIYWIEDDPRLELEDFSGHDRVDFPIDRLPWIPQVFVSKVQQAQLEWSAEVEIGTRRVFLTIEYEGEVGEVFELHRFPFDKQLLELQVRILSNEFRRDSPSDKAKVPTLRLVEGLSKDVDVGAFMGMSPRKKGGVKEKIKKKKKKIWQRGGDSEEEPPSTLGIGRQPIPLGEYYDDYNEQIQGMVRTKFEVVEWKGFDPDVVIDPIGDEDTPLGLKLTTYARMERYPEYYLWNVVFILFLIVSMCGLTNTIAVDAVADRYSVTLTLWLTAVAFKFVVAGFLPKTSYLTLMDIYVVACFLILTAVAVENGVASLVAVNNMDSALNWDLFFFSVVGGVWTLSHILIVFGAFRWNVFGQTWEQVRQSQQSADGGSASVE